MRDQIIQILRDETLWSGPFLVMPVSGKPAEVHQRDPENDDLGTARAEADCCHACRLAGTRKKVVFGEGNPAAAVMFIGEGPGAVEDETGRPFVGPAGGLLTDIIEKGMLLKRSDVYIANIVKCRPPSNRDPLPDEIAACAGYLDRQIRSIGPKVIVALGRVAAQTLLKDETQISRLRGAFRDYRGIMLMPTFHPSYLLQNPSKKRDVWEDIKKVMEALGIPPAR